MPQSTPLKASILGVHVRPGHGRICILRCWAGVARLSRTRTRFLAAIVAWNGRTRLIESRTRINPGEKQFQFELFAAGASTQA